jgi:hypothetical protein
MGPLGRGLRRIARHRNPAERRRLRRRDRLLPLLIEDQFEASLIPGSVWTFSMIET